VLEASHAGLLLLLPFSPLLAVVTPSRIRLC
jgi:hypothetical protein